MKLKILTLLKTSDKQDSFMDKGSHYNLCISDLIMGLLFIFILILLKFMLDYQDKKHDLSKPLVERNHIIEDIAKELEKENIKVEVDKENGVLKLNDIHYFDVGQYKLSQKGKEDFKKIQKTLSRNIICYSHIKSQGTQQKWPIDFRLELDKWINHCRKKKPNQYGLIDSILIEGHADSKPISKHGKLWRKGIKTNLDLATKRSITAFKTLTRYNEATSQKKATGNYLYALENRQEKPLFGVASYGNLRSNQNRSPAMQIKKIEARDRRIDIRFIMIQTDDIKETVSQISKDISQKE